ncbi:MAG TPA: zinc ribbon domain-containing protein [Pyrinomonadaceae bacterium]|nr:zinc ribbon domain-containing protein [Pyrinomonadaceae bacterium]
MFCPACGRENKSTENKFCASCGINLEAVSRALSRREDDFLTKIDTGFDQVIARYSERVFKNPPANPLDRGVGWSWRLLGKGAVTSFFDLLLFFLIWNILPLRFLILLISTPFRLLTERSKYQKSTTAELERKKVADLPEHLSQQWLPNSAASVTEQTTATLADSPRSNLNLKTIHSNKSRT